MDCYGNNSPMLNYDDEKKYWDLVHDEKEKRVAAYYVAHIHDPIVLIPSDIDEICTDYQSIISKKIVDDLFDTSFDEIICIIDESIPNLEIKTIPLFNDIYNGTYGMCQFLHKVKRASYVETGTFFTSEHNRIEARQKYGEEHLKLAASLGLVALYRPHRSSINVGLLTPLGQQCVVITQKEFDLICPKLILRIPIIAELIKRAKSSTTKVQDVMQQLGMKKSTIDRRTQSVKSLIRVLNEADSITLHERLSKIYW